VYEREVMVKSTVQREEQTYAAFVTESAPSMAATEPRRIVQEEMRKAAGEYRVDGVRGMVKEYVRHSSYYVRKEV